MSIATRVGPFSRSFRSLIKNTRPWQTIKDLKDLRIPRVCAGYRHSGPTDLKRTRDVFSVARAMARDRPSPYGEGRLSAAAPVGAPPYCIESGRARLHGFMKHPHFNLFPAPGVIIT